MNKNKILFSAIILLALFGLTWFSKPAPSETGATSSGGALAAIETYYDFGEISMKDGNVEKMFRIENRTNEDITLERVTTSCMCTRAFIEGGPENKGPFGMPGHSGIVPKASELIKAGEFRDIRVIFDPNAHGPAGIGLIERVVYLEESSGARTELEFRAVVKP